MKTGLRSARHRNIVGDKDSPISAAGKSNSRVAQRRGPLNPYAPYSGCNLEMRKERVHFQDGVPSSTTVLLQSGTLGAFHSPHRTLISLKLKERIGRPGEIRTPDPRFRKPLLYPSELQARRAKSKIRLAQEGRFTTSWLAWWRVASLRNRRPGGIPASRRPSCRSPETTPRDRAQA
jgi:hypothetical protein